MAISNNNSYTRDGKIPTTLDNSDVDINDDRERERIEWTAGRSPRTNVVTENYHENGFRVGEIGVTRWANEPSPKRDPIFAIPPMGKDPV